MSVTFSMPTESRTRTRGDAGGRLLLDAELAVRGGRRVDDEAADVADVRDVAVELQRVDEALTRPRRRP
jgi:hypothetical protein